MIWIIKLSISIGILGYIFLEVPVQAIFSSLSGVSIGPIFLAIPFILLVALVSAAQLKIFIENHQINLTLGQILKIDFATQFYNLFLPGYLAGGVIRWFKLSENNKKKAEVFAAIVLNRITNMLTLGIFGLIFWKFDKNLFPNNLYGLFFIILFSGLLILYFFIFSPRISCCVYQYFQDHRLPLVPRRINRGVAKIIRAAIEYQRLSLKEHVYIFSYSFLCHLFGAVIFLHLARALGILIPFISFCWIRSLLAVVMLLPISISGFGVREGSLIFLLKHFQIDPVDSVAFSFLVFGRTLAMGLIGGILEGKELFWPRTRMN